MSDPGAMRRCDQCRTKLGEWLNASPATPRWARSSADDQLRRDQRRSICQPFHSSHAPSSRKSKTSSEANNSEPSSKTSWYSGWRHDRWAVPNLRLDHAFSPPRTLRHPLYWADESLVQASRTPWYSGTIAFHVVSNRNCRFLKTSLRSCTSYNVSNNLLCKIDNS